jgi:hypothetical protein
VTRDSGNEIAFAELVAAWLLAFKLAGVDKLARGLCHVRCVGRVHRCELDGSGNGRVIVEPFRPP